MRDNGVKALASGLLIFGIILIIGMIASGNDSANTCIKAGCDNKCAEGSSYCYIHKPYTGSSSTRSTYSSGGSGSKSTNSGSTSSYSSTNKKSSSTSKSHSTGSGSTRTYNTLNNDPEDYDDPEEYADDAWGDDFDD